MKFALTNTKSENLSLDSWKKDYIKKLLDKYPDLKEFKYETISEVTPAGNKIYITLVEINSLEDLLKFKDSLTTCRKELIITNSIVGNFKEIEIYDGFRE